MTDNYQEQSIRISLTAVTLCTERTRNGSFQRNINGKENKKYAK